MSSTLPQESVPSNYKAIEIPEGICFSLKEVLLPSNASAFVVKHTASNGDPRTRTPKIVHALSEQAGNKAKLMTGSETMSGAARKSLWRTCGNNCLRENKRCRERYKHSRSVETTQEKQKRLARRRELYARAQKSAASVEASSSEVNSNSFDFSGSIDST
ncbi:hypothetical protein FGB62_199g06 [Gracilaria domingensis]|nr:hypothetical protein FGB62_199g06 [Gracilaria domingensis]